MRAIAIDDEPIALEVIKNHAAKVPFLELLAVFTDAFKALDYLQKEDVDLIFLDIKMPDISGIEFFNSLSTKPLVIFTTAYAEHAATSFDLDAIDYLLKPFSLARFLKGCNKAYEIFSFRTTNERADHLFIKTGYEQVKVKFDDILYLEAAGNYVTFVLQNGSILSRCTFSEAVSLLPADRFLRVHRSFIVALDKIERLERGQLSVNKKLIPVSDAYVQELMMALKKG